MTTVLLLDGNSLAYRAFFALPPDLATASGQVTNAVFGFTSMLTNLLRDHKPDLIAVAWDRPEPTFRHALVDDYKGGREAPPDILYQQLGLVKQLLGVLGITCVELVSFEADDIIATLATQGRDAGDDVIVVTGDRDAYQLVEDPFVRVLYNRRGVSDYVLYDEAGIQERTGVVPSVYAQYAALRGDPSDNLPGVPGVGEKTAAKLINEYGNLDAIFQNLQALTPKLRANLADFEATVRANATATPLVRDVPIEVSLDDLGFASVDVEEARRLFDFLEMKTVWDRITKVHPGFGAEAAGATTQATTSREVSARFVSSATEAAEVLHSFVTSPKPIVLAAVWEGAVGRSSISALACGESESETCVVVRGDLLADAGVVAALSELSSIPFRAHDAKPLLRSLLSSGIDLAGLEFDTAVLAYLADPSAGSYDLESVAASQLGLEVRSPDAPPIGQLDLGGGDSTQNDVDYLASSLAAIDALADHLAQQVGDAGMRALYDDVERPLIRVLARMEHLGVAVDVDRLRALGIALADEAQSLEKKIQELAGHPFQVNSTKQLQVVLFDELKLNPQKKTKTGFSTDAQTLEKLLNDHPIIEKLLRYREVEKLRSTYGVGLLAEVAPDGRIHATFNQTVARTGRLSSDQPNLHNIPVRTDEGRRFRECFVPSVGTRFLVADYNQIELRVIAHLAEDPGLIDAFTSGTDIHTATAARVFGVEPESVTHAQRAKAKMVSYGLAYGMEAYGLAQRLAIEVGEAQHILDAYFVAFPSVRAYMDRVVEEARRKGYTETLFGRRRPIPELRSDNFRIRQAGERQAMNAGIQGLAADLFKVALVRLDQALEERRLVSQVCLQVHDEVLVEVPEAEASEVEDLVRTTMRSVGELLVPLEVNLSWGSTWADAKS